MHQFPADTPISIDDVRNSGWAEIIKVREQATYDDKWKALSEAAKSAIESGDLSSGKALWLLADACSMRLDPGSPSRPFLPFFGSHCGRAVIPEDFEDETLALFLSFYKEVDDPRLRARLADLLWVRKAGNGIDEPKAAIAAYCELPLCEVTWHEDNGECWGRSLQLALMLGEGAIELVSDIESAVMVSIRNASSCDGFLVLWLAELLSSQKVGSAFTEEIVGILDSIAETSLQECGFERSRQFLFEAIEWCKMGREIERQIDFSMRVAGAWAMEAEARLTGSRPSNMAAANFYEKAIQAFRSVPKTRRDEHGIEEKIAELHTKLELAGRNTLGEMNAVTTGQMNIGHVINASRAQVRGRTARAAFRAFCNIARVAVLGELRTQAEKSINEFPLRHLLESTHLSSDGRKVAATPGVIFDSANPKSIPPGVWVHMIWLHQFSVGESVFGRIIPALEVLRVDHRIKERDFILLARQSSVVPSGRERLLGRAFFLGYEGDFSTAIHILAPQVEHMIRTLLKNNNVKTTKLSSDGIEQEVGLSALMEKSEIEKVMNENLAFEIEAIFCNPTGPNLRNNIAHGLVDDESSESVYTCYGWWLGLKMVLENIQEPLAENGESAQMPDEAC